jgi:proteasome lid subunit RPN8/RPN11
MKVDLTERGSTRIQDIAMARQKPIRQVTIAPHALDAIRRHAAAAFPDECCGALIEWSGTIFVALALQNTTDEGARRRFRVGPEGYRTAEAFARAAGGTLAGFYHSHPDEPARPSQYDLEHAWPNLAYVILGVNAGVPGDVTVWHLRDDRSGFDEGELQWHIRS